MSNAWLEQSISETQERITPLPGVALAIVTQNIDATGQGRVQVEFPWLAELRPWARVASPGAGRDRGFYMIPQVGDEVLVAFAHGDLRDPYIIGSLWNRVDRPPYSSPDAAEFCRMLRTPIGHEFEFDDLRQTITLKTAAGQKIEMTSQEVVVTPQEGMASISLSVDGSVTIKARNGIRIEGTEVSISGVNVQVAAQANVQIQAGGVCEIQGSLVKIN